MVFDPTHKARLSLKLSRRAVIDPEPPVDVPGKLTVNLREADVRATVTSACARPTHHCASLPSPSRRDDTAAGS